MERIRSFFSENAAVGKLRAWMLTPAYPAFFAVFALLSYCTGTELYIGAMFVLVGCTGLLICKDLRPMIAPLLTFVFALSIHNAPQLPTHSDYYYSTPVLVVTAIAAALVAVSLVLHFVIWQGAAIYYRHRPMLWHVCIALALGLVLNGVFAEWRFTDTLYGAAQAALWILFYLLFLYGLPYNKKTVEYFCICCFFIILLLAGELIYIYLHHGVAANGIIRKYLILFGWGVHNNLGGIMVWLIPAMFYLAATRKNGWFYFLAAIGAYVCAIFTMSRSAMLVGGAVMLICLISVCVKGNNKGLYRSFLCVMGAVFVIAVFAFWRELAQLFSFTLSQGFEDSGRLSIWRNSIMVFAEHPIFGGGFHSVPFESWAGDVPGHCHNTVIEMLCACGAVGCIAYLVYRAATVRMFVRYMTLERFYMGMVIVGLLGVSLLDNHLFNYYPPFFYTVALAFGERDYRGILDTLGQGDRLLGVTALPRQ